MQVPDAQQYAIDATEQEFQKQLAALHVERAAALEWIRICFSGDEALIDTLETRVFFGPATPAQKAGREAIQAAHCLGITAAQD